MKFSHDCLFIFDGWWQKRFRLTPEKQIQISLAMCGSLMLLWGTIYFFSRKLPLKASNKQLFSYLSCFSLPLLIVHVIEMYFFHQTGTGGNISKGLFLLLFSLRLGITTVRLYISHRSCGAFVLIAWFATLASLHSCIIFPDLVARALLDKETIHLAIKVLYSIMIVSFHAEVCSVKTNLMRFLMALTVFLPNGTIDFISEFELWFVINTCLGFALFSRELYIPEGKFNQMNSRREPLVLGNVHKTVIKAKLQRPAPGRLEVLKPCDVYQKLPQKQKAPVEIKKRAPPPSLLVLKKEYGITVSKDSKSSPSFEKLIEDKMMDDKKFDFEYTPPDLDHHTRESGETGCKYDNDYRPSISISPCSLDRRPVDTGDPYDVGGPWHDMTAPWTDEPGIFPIRDEMATAHPDPVPTAHPTVVPTASFVPQPVKSKSSQTPQRRERSFSSPSLSDTRNEDLIPRRRNARNRRQLVIKMIDEIILGNDSLIAPDQHTLAYDEFISRRGLENAPQSHV